MQNLINGLIVSMEHDYNQWQQE